MSGLARDLPDAGTLVDYQPQLPTVVRGNDGAIVHSYARERRVQLQYEDFPQLLIDAYLAAEDRTFFSHGGIDATGDGERHHRLPQSRAHRARGGRLDDHAAGRQEYPAVETNIRLPASCAR